MIIRKEYDIGLLSERLKKEIIEAEDRCNYYVRIPILVATNILDVLQETLEREKRNQTLESALQFVETEDEEQTNAMEYYNRAEETIKEMLPECIGRYNGTDYKCLNCYANVECNNLYIERTSSIEKRTPSCFKHFYDNNKQCDNTECVHRKECVESTKRTMPGCFGDFDCETASCQRCGSRNECRIETK